MSTVAITFENSNQAIWAEKRRLQINLRVLRKSNFLKSRSNGVILLRLNKYAGVYYTENQYLGHCISDEIFVAHLINWAIIY